MTFIGKKLIDFLNEYDLQNKIITYVKDEGFHLNIIISIFIYMMKYSILGLEHNF